MDEITDSQYGMFWGDTLFPKTITKIPIIENFLYESDVMCIKGKEACGKSILAQQLVSCLTSGTDFLDTYHITKKYRVLWIQTEGDREETFERIGNMERALAFDHEMWGHLFLAGASMNTPRGMRDIIKEIEKSAIKAWDVVIIDPLYTTIQGALTADNVASDWVRNVREMRGMIGNPSIIVLHHENKTMYHQGEEVERKVGDVFGAFGWQAFFNSIYRLSIKSGIHTLSSGKDRGFKTAKKIDMKLIEPSPLLFVTDDKHLTVGSSLVERYIRDHANVTRREIIAGVTEVSESTIDRAIKKFKDNGTLEKFHKDGQDYYKWR